VVPMEICFKDTGKKDQEGFPIKQFNIYILKPIFSKTEFTEKQNMEFMRDRAHEEAVEQYEKFYNRKLVFNIDEKLE